MQIYPAIDIKDGSCVRLLQGDFSKTTVFEQKPYIAAKRFEDMGATYLHIVDLDGARLGSGYNDNVISEILSNINIPIQVGGGIRTIADIEKKLAMGVSRVILGTVAVSNKALVKEAVSKYGGNKIAVGIDAKNGQVALEGWQTVSSTSALELCLEMKDLGVETIIYTDIAKDGMLQGPSLESTREIVKASSPLNIIASGGVTTLKDLEAINEIKASGAIIGRALYENAINLKEAISLFQNN